MNKKIRDIRFLSLLFATVLALLACIIPKVNVSKETYDWMVLIDITQSMNVTDYDEDGIAVSRLQKIKNNLQYVLNHLPCGSSMGLGVFTERTNAALFFPIEVCENYQLIVTTIDKIDWRMAWVADSNIARGLENGLSLMSDEELQGINLAFITDGHEAPPVNPDYEPDFSEYNSDQAVPGAVRLAAQQRANRDTAIEFEERENTFSGLIIGAGGYVPVRIPRFDEDGIQRGFFTEKDVPHASRFGLPKDPSKIPGYVPRNAEWGPTAPTGTEHLSEVREEYLRELASKTHLDYVHLDDAHELFKAFTRKQYAKTKIVSERLGKIPALLALFFLCMVYVSNLRGNPVHHRYNYRFNLKTHYLSE